MEGLVASVTLAECSFTVPEVIVSISDLQTEIIRVWPYSILFNIPIFNVRLTNIQFGVIGLQGRLVDRTYDTKIFLSLNQIWIEDHYQKWGDKFSFLASSCGDKDKSDLIKTCYTVLNKVLPLPNSNSLSSR